MNGILISIQLAAPLILAYWFALKIMAAKDKAEGKDGGA
jgi:hypothetical protein